MFAPPTRAGTVCGWAPSNDSHEPFYTTISTTSSPYSHPLYAHPSLPLASTTPRAVRNPIPRSLSLDSAVRPRSISDATDTTDTSSSSYQPYDNPTSARRNKAKRQQDPSWAPRPPNAFILFRRDYVTEHKAENDPSDNKEKTLSKRAGDAWRSLSLDEKEPWFVRAKDEALSHASAYPNYVFRPRKRRSEPRKHPALLSRREQVEEFVRKTSRRRALRKRDRPSLAPSPAPSPVPFNCPTPGSAGSSSSPELPGTPLNEESNPLTSSVPTGLQSRSDSLPARLDYTPIFPPPPNRTYLSQTAMLSMPSLATDHRPIAPKRSFSHSDMPPYSPWDYVNLGDEYSESDDTSIFSFESAPSEQRYHGVYLGVPSEQPSPGNFETSLQGPDGHFMPEPQVPSPGQRMPEPQASSSIDPSTLLPSTNFAYPPPPASPLFERRRRAATISTLPSPLTVVTSSLSGWARDDLVTARMVPRADPSSSSSSSQVVQMPQPQPHNLQLIVDNDNWMRNVPQNMHETLAMPEADLDYTPRFHGFPQNIHSAGPALDDLSVEFPMPEPQLQQNIPVPNLDPYDLSADLDLECYSLGLRQFGIGNSGTEATNYGMPSFDVDYAALFPEASAQE